MHLLSICVGVDMWFVILLWGSYSQMSKECLSAASEPQTWIKELHWGLTFLRWWLLFGKKCIRCSFTVALSGFLLLWSAPFFFPITLTILFLFLSQSFCRLWIPSLDESGLWMSSWSSLLIQVCVSEAHYIGVVIITMNLCSQPHPAVFHLSKIYLVALRTSKTSKSLTTWSYVCSTLNSNRNENTAPEAEEQPLSVLLPIVPRFTIDALNTSWWQMTLCQVCIHLAPWFIV